ncbi:hypothetical protein R7Q39_05615 [Vibrio sp. 947]|uniref:hypothetical protein n=1 Tax=Vibrio sp. 947 TaxID=3074619 RepID=UPI002964301F|nr:hypothetical protein [Vibrio sp. 947]MDW1924897.1 hypothetical protein [Vibrio sp. 947]
MNNWKSWKIKYSKQIEHVAGYEEAFVDRVLSQIPEISPDDVIPQYHFVDDYNGNRYIDFMILNKAKGYYLPIELDGTYKDVNHQKWKDFLVRQNSLITKFGIVLRFSNKQMLGEPKSVINKIRHTLDIQSNNKITEASKQRERESLISWYNNKLSELSRENDNTESITRQITDLRVLVEEIRLSTPAFQNEVKASPEPVKSEGKSNFWLGVSITLAAVLLVAIFMTNNQNDPFESKNPSSLVTLNPTSDKESEHTLATSKENFQAVTHALDENEFSVESLHSVDAWQEVPEENIKQVLSNEDWPPANTIAVASASKHEGAYNVVCGVVVQVTNFSKGTYLNFEKAFPDTPFTSVVWDSDADYVLTNIASFNVLRNQKVCVHGEITIYNGRPQMIVNSPNQIELF